MGTRENVKITRKAADNTYLVLLQPLLKQLLAALLEDRTRKFNRLQPVELALLEENTEVLEDGRETARRSRRLLERLDDLRGAEDALGTK